MKYLDYVETHIINICNLRCKGCSHFAPFVGAEDASVDIRSFESDLAALSKLFDHIFTFRMLGGEPFLCRELTDFCQIARRILPTSDIRLVSNGLLIPRMADDVLREIAALGIGVDISRYPVTSEHLGEIRAALDAFGISYRISEPVVYFHKRLNLRGDSDPEAVFQNCPSSRCVFFLGGKLANCSAPLLAHFINKRFGTSIESGSDLLDLHREGLTADDVTSFLSQPMSACRYCSAPKDFLWTCVTTPKLEDWDVNACSGVIS